MILPFSPIYSKSTEVWFNDGNIVLEAEDTVFRIFSGILASNSVVFNEMFTFPQPPDEETFEGCPLVHLADSAVDLMYFLKAIHDARYESFSACDLVQNVNPLFFASFYDLDHITDFFVVAGVLRLSTKYEVPYLRERSIKALSSLYPSDLAEFEATIHKRSRIESFHGRVFAAVNLVRECNVPSILPVALFRCCTGMDVVELIDGAFGQDGFSHYALEWTDKRLCLIARAVLETRARKYTMSFLMGSSPEAAAADQCATREACDSVRLRFLRAVELTNANYGKVNPLLTGLRWDLLEKDICASCYRSARESFEREKASLWEDLPTIFQLGTWDELKR